MFKESCDFTTFKSLGLRDELCKSCENLGWKSPTRIQAEAIPIALKGKSVLGVSETGSGKTAAFSLPILHALCKQPRRHFALILVPTRELGIQIYEQLMELGKDLGLECLALVGGVPVMEQVMQIILGPHIVVATLGRLVSLINGITDTSWLECYKYLVIDEADRILSQDNEDELDKIMRVLTSRRTTMLYTATLTRKVQEVQRKYLRAAIKLEVISTFKIVDTLEQYMISIPFTDRSLYLVYLTEKIGDKSAIVFCNCRSNTLNTTLLLRFCGRTAIPLYGDMRQEKRLEALEKFKQQRRSVLVATNVAARGLDIPCVDYVINLEVPMKCEDYVHRVGRTARAGRSGVAITLVTQLEIEDFLNIERQVMTQNSRMNVYPTHEEELLKLRPKVADAEKRARKWQRMEEKRRKENDDIEDDEDAPTVKKRIKNNDQIDNKFVDVSRKRTLKQVKRGKKVKRFKKK